MARLCVPGNLCAVVVGVSVVVVVGAVSLGLLRRGCHAVPMDA